MKDCIFCKIIRGELPSSVVYEDDLVFAFMDIRPINQGHILVVPRQHAESIADVEDETVAHMLVIANRINRALRKSDIKTEGINYLLADGKAAGQEVFHAHLHIIPRYQGDGFGLRFPKSYPQSTSRESLQRVSEEIKALL